MKIFFHYPLVLPSILSYDLKYFPTKKAGEERKAIEKEREKKAKVKVETAVLLLSPPSELWRLAFFIWK